MTNKKHIRQPTDKDFFHSQNGWHSGSILDNPVAITNESKKRFNYKQVSKRSSLFFEIKWSDCFFDSQHGVLRKFNPVAITDQWKPISQKLVGFFVWNSRINLFVKDLTNKKSMQIVRFAWFSFSKWMVFRINLVNPIAITDQRKPIS